MKETPNIRRGPVKAPFWRFFGFGASKVVVFHRGWEESFIFICWHNIIIQGRELICWHKIIIQGREFISYDGRGESFIFIFVIASGIDDQVLVDSCSRFECVVSIPG